MVNNDKAKEGSGALCKVATNMRVFKRFRIYSVFIKYCVFSTDFRIFRTLAFLCFPSVSVCVHKTGREKTNAAAELADFIKITKFQGKKTQYLMNTLYVGEEWVAVVRGKHTFFLVHPVTC